MALWMPESKFRDHFSIQTSPQNPQKATSGTKIGPRKVIFGNFFSFNLTIHKDQHSLIGGACVRGAFQPFCKFQKMALGVPESKF